MIESAIRQVVDIQNQINVVDSSEREQLQSIFVYSSKLKSYLLDHVNDKLVRRHINEIPDLKLEDFRIRRSCLQVAISFLIFYENFHNDKYDYFAAGNSLNIIRDKYASLELLMKNSLTSL
jgi:hypothetical protein